MGRTVGFWEILSRSQVFTTSDKNRIAHALSVVFFSSYGMSKTFCNFLKLLTFE